MTIKGKIVQVLISGKLDLPQSGLTETPLYTFELTQLKKDILSAS
jgi:hypothetical protein